MKTQQKRETTPEYEQTPGPKYKINSTLYRNREWHGEKGEETEKRGRRKQDNLGERTKRNQKRRNEGHTNHAQWGKQRGENQKKTTAAKPKKQTETRKKKGKWEQEGGMRKCANTNTGKNHTGIETNQNPTLLRGTN